MALPCKVSVIVPVYNVETYLPECLDSLLAQTLLDIEIVCVDDHSTDSSAEILKQYAEKDYRISVIENPGKGVGSARNTGIKNAHGGIIMFCDADDRLSPDACERVWLEFKLHPTDAVVFCASLFPEIGDIPSWLPWNLQVAGKRYPVFVPQIIFGNPAAAPFVWRNAFSIGMIQRSKVFFREDLDLGEDLLFLLQIYPHAELGISVLRDRLYEYRWMRPGSLMDAARKDHDERIAKHLLVLSGVFEYYRDNGLMEQYGTDLLDWALRFIVPDTYQEDVKERAQHLRAFYEQIKHFGAEKFLSGVRKSAKTYVRKLLKNQKD